MNERVKPRSTAFISDIEVLRACAVLLVIFAHTFFLFPWSNSYYNILATYIVGWPGVDLFFCISGYVIARDLLRSRAEAANTEGFLGWAVPFWIRRAWRILPSAWFWATFAFFASAWLDFLPGAGNSSAVYPEWIASMVQSVNLYYVSCSPDCPPGSVFTSVYWSLGLEEQFYIVLPFVLFFVPRRWLAPLLTVLFVIQFPLNRPQAPPNALWYMRTDAIVLGVLIALGHHDGHLRLLEPTFLKQRLWRWAAIPALIFLIGAISHTAIWLSTGLIAIACAALVLIASFNADYVMTDGMTKRCFMWIGSRSFALYLIHLPVYSFTRWVVSLWKNPATPYSDHQTWVFVLIAWPILLLTAEANFRLIESPLRRHGRRMADVVAQRSRLASVRP